MLKRRYFSRFFIIIARKGRKFYEKAIKKLSKAKYLTFYESRLFEKLKNGDLEGFDASPFREAKYKDYTKLYNLLIKDDKKVIDVINESKDKLEEHLVKSLEKPQLLNIKVFEFSSCYKLYEDVLSLEEKINHKNVDRKFEVKYISKLNLLFALVFCLLFIVLFFTK